MLQGAFRLAKRLNSKLSANPASISDNSTDLQRTFSARFASTTHSLIIYLTGKKMNHVVAYKLLADELAAYRQLPADEICQLAGEHSSRLVRGEDGVDYNISIVVRSHHDNDDIRVIGFVGLADWGSSHDVLNEAIVRPISGN